MEISVFLFVLLNINLVLTDDSVAMDTNIAYKDTQKSVTEPLEDSQIDQIADSSHSVGQTYDTGNNNQNQVQIDVGTNGQNAGQNQQHADGLSHDAGNLEILQPALTQVYPPQGQPIYVQYPLQPIRIFGAEASPLYQNQLQENEGHTIGYSSYVEHVSQKDEEEIKSALQQGSVSDIKRLVPKSGISFKIYKNHPEDPKIESATAGYSPLHHRTKTELPVTQQYQTLYQQQPVNGLGSYQQHELTPNLLSHPQNQQNEQTHYFTQPEVNPQKTLETGKTLPLFKPNFRINVGDNSYSKATSAAEYNSLSGLTDVTNYPKYYDAKSEGTQKAVKKIPPTAQYEVDPVTLADRNKDVKSYNKQKTNYFVENQKNVNANYQRNLAKKGYQDKKAVSPKNRQPGNYADGVKQIVSHLGTAYSDSVYKGSQSEYFPLTSYPDSESAKTGQHLISLDVKNSQNFDHQKALEGSTSFDIKNAIDSSGSLIHQDVHSLDVSKQNHGYVIPNVVADTGVHEAPSYHPVATPEVSGKLLQPQTVVWNPEHFKHTSDLHQPVIKLHLPKEEFYHLKTPNIELPTSYQQKQPFLLHYDVPVVKYPQEIHFHPKRLQGGSIKQTQPLAIDWSLFKSTFPNFNPVAIKPELTPHIQDTGKKIVPILIRKRKNRSNNKQEIGMVVYGKINNKRRPVKPIHRQEKNVRVNLLPEASSHVTQFEPKGERKNEFSVSASYKVDRSFKMK